MLLFADASKGEGGSGEREEGGGWRGCYTPGTSIIRRNAALGTAGCRSDLDAAAAVFADVFRPPPYRLFFCNLSLFATSSAMCRLFSLSFFLSLSLLTSASGDSVTATISLTLP